jgi:hypothetical protein
VVDSNVLSNVMKTAVTKSSDLVMKRLREFGLLLKTDTKLPSVCGLVVGGPVRGSWWGHARAHEIFAVLQMVADHKDVLVTRLVSDKETFVHRKLWPEIISIGAARQTWQFTKLTAAARSLLKEIDKGPLRSDHVQWPGKFKSVKPGDVIRELEKRLLIHTEEFHTEKGAHAKLLESWEAWVDRIHFKARSVDAARAMKTLEQKLQDQNEKFDAIALLPWQ